MYNILPESKDHIIAVRVVGYMRSQDYQTLLPHLKRRVELLGKVSLIVELKDFKGIEILGILRAIPYTFKYGKYIEKKAIITDENWVYTWTSLFSTFSKTKVRCFPSTQVEQAWEWVKQ
jgi:hypothetical protein